MAPELCIFQGTPSRTAVELDVMNRYFVFLVIVRPLFFKIWPFD